MGALNPEWVVVAEEFWRYFLALTCFLKTSAGVRGFDLGGVHRGAGVPRMDLWT